MKTQDTIHSRGPKLDLQLKIEKESHESSLLLILLQLWQGRQLIWATVGEMLTLFSTDHFSNQNESPATFTAVGRKDNTGLHTRNYLKS